MTKFIITETLPTYGKREAKQIATFDTYAEACIAFEKIDKNNWNIYEIKKIK